MKKLLAVPISLILVLAATAASKGTYTGWVTDSKCGVKGTNAQHAACAEKCIAAGEKMAFVPDGTQDVLTVDNPASLKGQEGQHVTIKGDVNASTKTIHVASLEKEKK